MKRHAIGIAAALVLIGPSSIASAQTDTSTANYVTNGCRGFLSKDGRVDRRVVVAYIEQRPARMHEKFGLLAVEALQKAWPCR
jgi:hypothetical protein